MSEGPCLKLPIGSRPMGDVHVRAPILEHQARAARADVDDARAGARQHADVGPVREGELRLVSRWTSARSRRGEARRHPPCSSAWRGGRVRRRPRDEAGSRQRPQRHSGSDAPADLSPARLPGARRAQDLDGHGDAPSARLFEPLRVRRENVDLTGDKGGQAGGARVETVHARVRRRWQKAHDVGAAPDGSCPGHAFFARTVPWPMVIR